MTIDEIIKRQKEHLTKAQINELIQATERYKQLNAANRAQATGTLTNQYRATRRGLQNTGLAGRKGKLVSGQEKAARIRANEAYRSYNAGLRQIDNAYAQNRAARMANETAMANQLAETERIQAENDKEAARINAEYEAWLRKKKAAEAEYKRRQEEIERLRAQQQAQQQQIRERIEEDRTEQSGVVQGNRIQRLAKDKHPQLETSDYARAAQEQAVQRAVNDYQQTQKVFRQQREADAMYDALHPGSAITRAPHTDDYFMEQKRVENARQLKGSGASDAEVWFADSYGVSASRYKTVKNENPELIKELTGAIQSIRANSDTWDAILNGEDESHQVKGIGTVRTKAYTAAEKNKARTEKASAYRTLAIADAAMRIENESVRKLFVMDDAAFDVMYAAALQIYKIRVNQAENLPFDNDRVTGESTTATYNRLMAEAAETFAPYEAAKRLKDESQEEAFIAGTYGLDETLTPKRPDWLKGSIYSDGHENWVEAHNRGWSADDYEKNADHRVGNYEALVNEWSFINGRTALLYTQNFQVTNDIANIGEWVGHAFGGDINRNEAYRSFRRKCESKMGVSSEKMDSLLTLSNLMTDEERARYNTILRDGGAEEADKYFEYLYESVLPNRFEQFVENELASQTNTPEERLLQSIVSVPNNLIQGVSGTIHTMTTNVDDPVAARLDAKKYTTAQAMRGAVGSHYGETGNFLYQGVMSMADSTTVALVGQGIGGILKGTGVASGLATKAGSVLGGSLLGATAYTSAYEEAIQRGLSPEKAKQTALANGINEMLFEAVSLDILVGHFQKGGILKVSKNGFVNWVVNTLVSAGVEGSEEVFTDIANRLWDNRINGVFSEELTAVRKYMMEDGLTYKQALQKVNDEFGAQLWESFKAGALSGGVMGGGASFLGMVQNRGNEKVGKGLRQNSRVMNELRNFDFKSEYAQEILTQDKLTNQDVADLFNIRQQELLGQYESDIQQAVADGKITQEQADLLKKYEQNGVQIVHDGEVVANENGITVEQMPSVQDAIANLDNAARIQFLNNEEMRSLVQAVGGETAAVIEQSETAEREAEKAYRQTIAEINSDTTLTDEQKAERKEEAKRTRQNARSEAEKIADAALTNKKGIGAKLETDGNGTVKVGKGSGKVTYDFSTKDNPGHQTVDSMTATEQSALRIAKIVAASRGDVNVKVEAEFGVDENGIDHSNENGYYNPKTNTIHINMSGDNSVLWTLSHELTHHLANTDTEAYAALRTAIETALKDSKLTTTELEDRGFEYDLDRVDPYIAREGNLWDALVAFEREEHGYGKDAEEEVVARCCESFIGFDQFVKDFAHKQYKSARAVNKFIAQMNIDMQRVSEDARQSAVQRNVWNDESPENQILRQLTEIDRIANLWRIAVNAEAKKRQAAREETRASTKDSVKRSDAEYLDLAHRYESGDKSAEPELRKMVDAAAKRAGYRAEAYHGTFSNFTKFDVSKSQFGNSGYGIYLGEDWRAYEYARKYDMDAKPMHLYFNNERIAHYDDHRITEEMVRKAISKLNLSEEKFIKGYVKTHGYKTLKEYVENVGDYEIIYQIERSATYPEWYANDTHKRFKPRGILEVVKNVFPYDGMELRNDEIVLFDNHLLKSADLITKDDNGNIIPLSERFNAKEEDIRYSVKDNVKLSDSEYMNLAEKYKNGTATETETEALRKAVDAAAKAAGYNTKAYHGTRRMFNVFRGANEMGYHFGTKAAAQGRVGRGKAARIIPAYIRANNPIVLDFDMGSWDANFRLADELHEMKVLSVDELNEVKYGNDGVRRFKRSDESANKILQGILKAKGYDSIKYKNTMETKSSWSYIVYDASQAKSADLITYDSDGNIIPLSERFKTDRTGEDAWKNEDIRYSLKDDVRLTTDLATLAGQMHEGAKGARALREQSERYNERIDELNGRIGKLNKRIAELKAQIDDVSLAERMHQGAEDAAELRKVRDEYNERIAQRDRLLEQVRKQRDAAKRHAVEVREQERAARVRRDIVAVLKRGNDRIVKLLANPTENSHVPVQLAQAVAEYAQRLNQLLTTSEPKTGEFAGIEKQTKKGSLNAQKIIDALNRSYADKETIDALKAEDPSFNPRGLLVQYDEKGNIVKDETLVKMINGMDSIIQGKHLSELAEDELRFVLNTMRGVIHTVTEANKVTVQGEQRDVYRESRQMANEVNSATKVFGDKSNKITKFMNRYVIESLGLRRIAKLYSGSDENAVFVKMVDDLNDGALEQERIKQTLRGMFNEVTSKYAKEMDTWYGKNAEWIDTGFGFKITKGMRVSLAMHILNSQNLRNVEKAGLRIPDMNAYRKGSIKEAYTNGKVFRLTKEQAQQIVDNMTEAEKAYFEVAKEFFHKRSGYFINRTSLKLLGYSKAVVKNYFPIQTDDAYRTVKYDDVRQNASVEHPGFLESRKGTANVMYLNDITAVVNRQIDGVAKYAGLAIPMRNWNNIMNAWLFEENEDGEWVRSDAGRAHDVLERRMGYTNGKQGKSMAIIDYVDQFITDLTSPRVRDANEKVHAAEFAAKITSNYVKAVLTLNARVALSQLASVPTAAAEIPWKYIVQSFGGNVEGHLNRNASNDLIDQYTPIFAMRRAGTQTEVSEVMKRRGFADKAEQKLPGLLGWITAMDVAATRRLWYACERWVKGETNIPVGSNAFYEEVARRYERVIQNTQPNFTVLQRSPALRSKSAAARIITMFGTQRMQNAGVFIESLAEVVQTKDKVKRKVAMKKFGRTLSGLITAAIVIGLERALVSALRGRMRPLQDEDKDITVGSVSKYIMGEIGTSLAGSFMYVGELYDFVHGVVGGLADGDSGYETSFALPAAEALSTTIKFFKDKDWQYFEYMRGDHTDHEKWLKTRSFVNELMTVASYVTGLPLANASKTILNGAVPLVQDIVESTKTGELNLYLHQSGKLDNAKTAENYKEWTNLGKKGSVYLAWENRFKDDDSNGIAHRAELLFADRGLTADEKAILLRMANTTKDNPLTSKDGVVYKEDGTVAVDFTNLDRYRASTMLSDKQYEGFLNLVDMGVAEDVASTAFIQYNVQKKQGSGANDRFRDWLFNTIKNPEDRAKVDMAVVGNTVRVEGTIGYKENGEVYADYSSKEMFDLYTSGKKQQKSDAIISTTDTPEAKAKAFADTDNDYHAKGGIVYNDKDKVVADFTSDEAYHASQMGESHYAKYTDAVKQGMSKENAILAVEKHKEFTNDDDKDNATQYATWVFNTYKSAKDRAIAGLIYTTKPVTIKDGRTYDENGYIYRDYTSAAWYKLSNRTLSSDGTNKRYEAAKKLVNTGLTAERIVEIYEGTTGLSKKSEWKEYLKSLKLTNEQIDIFMKSRWK